MSIGTPVGLYRSMLDGIRSGYYNLLGNISKGHVAFCNKPRSERYRYSNQLMHISQPVDVYVAINLRLLRKRVC